MNNFSKAAASYFGLGDIVPRKVDMFSDGPANILVIELNLTDEDLAGIVARMQNRAVTEAPDNRLMQNWKVAPQPTREELRAEYIALSKKERSVYGSFHVYCTARAAVDPYTAPAPVDLPPYVYLAPAECTAQQRAMAIGQDEKGNYAIAVDDLTEEQARQYVCLPASIEQARGGDEFSVTGGVGTITPDGLYTAPPATEKEQSGNVELTYADGPTAARLRQAYDDRTVQAYERLSGADGKPTSNADDFGGLPG